MQESQKIFIFVYIFNFHYFLQFVLIFSTVISYFFFNWQTEKKTVCTFIVRSLILTSTAQIDQIRGNKLISKLVKSSQEFVIKVLFIKF